MGTMDFLYSAGYIPTSLQLTKELAKNDHTPAEAGHLIYVSEKTMQEWVAGVRRIPASAWELYHTKMRINKIANELTIENFYEILDENNNSNINRALDKIAEVCRVIDDMFSEED